MNYELTDKERAYIAGIIDGEGCIIATSDPKVTFHVGVVHTSTRLLNYLQKTTNSGSVYNATPSTLGSKPVYEWRVGSDDASCLLLMLLPYLIVKKEEAEVALEFRRLCKAQRSYYEHTRGKRVPGDFKDERAVLVNRLKELKRKEQ